MHQLSSEYSRFYLCGYSNTCYNRTDGHFPFLKLPAELRIKIYHYVYGDYDIYINCSSWPGTINQLVVYQSFKDTLRLASSQSLSFGLVLANRRIGEEAAFVLYSTPVFEIRGAHSLTTFLLAISDRRLALITRLILHVHFDSSDGEATVWKSELSARVLVNMKALIFLQVWIWSPVNTLSRSGSVEIGSLKKSDVFPCLQSGFVKLLGTLLPGDLSGSIYSAEIRAFALQIYSMIEGIAEASQEGAEEAPHVDFGQT